VVRWSELLDSESLLGWNGMLREGFGWESWKSAVFDG
jgi:hypothetical protein